MGESLLRLWDELDDVAGICRHVTTSAASEVIATVAPLIGAVSTALLAGAATLLLSRHTLLTLLA
jgi:hypothetical protein